MNKWLGMGRLTRDVEMRNSIGENANVVARFSLAVGRRFKNAEGNYDADFINCVAFGKTAEFIAKYFKKGDMMAVTARVQTGSYTNKDGVKVYTTDMVIEEVDFCGGKNIDTTTNNSVTTNFSNNDFMKIPDTIDEELPFS